MPFFTPGRRWQPPYYPFKRESFGQRMLARIERSVKGPLWGCRMCGNCLLQETAFICPMECPKGTRNGPCGGSTEEACYVDETRPCIWYEIYERSFKMGRQEMLLEVLPPLDWDKVGTETWGDVVRQLRKVGVRHFAGAMLSARSAATHRGMGFGLLSRAPAGVVAGRFRVSCTRLRRTHLRARTSFACGRIRRHCGSCPADEYRHWQTQAQYRDGKALCSGHQLHG